MLERYQSIDAIKAIAIFLVVLGHSFQSTILFFDSNLYVKFIYSFHMPLFIYVSGFLNFRNNEFEPGYLKNKTIALIFPYFSWMILAVLLNSFESSIDIYTLISKYILYPDNGLWFLWVVFWMHFVIYVIRLLFSKHIHISLCVFYIIYAYSIYICKIDNTFSLKTFGVLFPYYILGYFSNKNSAIALRFYSKWYLSAPLFLTLVPYWHRVDSIALPFYLFNSELSIFLFKLIVGVLGVNTVFGLIFHRSKFNEILLYVGRNTLPVYAVNFILILHLNFFLHNIDVGVFYYISTIGFAFLIISISLYIGYILKINKILRFLFLGVY